MNDTEFRDFILQKGQQHWRDMPWRRDTNAYYVLVSEMMLQQTQVSRVVPKFEAFVSRFRDVHSLATAPLNEVLSLWQGLGYNRRAKYLHSAAQMIVDSYDGQLPSTLSELVRLPGVGNNTAAAIVVYSYNHASLFVETNIRTVYLHHFFAGQTDVHDSDILTKLDATLDHTNPRRFYQALMDYGSFLKRSGVKNIRQSRHYKKQSPLAGSHRQMRGEIIRRLTQGKPNWNEDIEHDSRFEPALRGLLHDGLIEPVGTDYRLTHSR